MSAGNRAISLKLGTTREATAGLRMASAASPLPETEHELPKLQVLTLFKGPRPRRFARVPTHTVGVHPEQREYPRASLRLPLRLRSVDGVEEKYPVTLVTRDLSATGVCFLCPRELPLSACLELEIVLVSRPLGRGNVMMITIATVRRIELAATPGWFGVAASFDDMEFGRDDMIPSRFLDE